MKKKDPNALNKREKAILKFIEKQIKIKGYPPSVREIGKAVDLKSTATVHGYLNQLEKKGYIKVEPRKTRGITILGEITYDRYSNSNKDYNEAKRNYQYGSSTKNKSNRGSIWL